MQRGIITVLAASAIGMALALGGCTASAAPKLTADQLIQMSPEQLEQINQMGNSVIGCIQLGGPPPVGGGSLLIVPKSAASGSIKFSPDCHPTGDITLGK